MSKPVRTAVFPAGGLGTRFLPATKVIPKEMLALVDKPIIQYGVEEAIDSGIEHIIIITGRGKGAMEDHFDHSFELDATLERRGKTELLAVSRGVASLARISYVRQKEPLGLGHAVLCARELVGDEPFGIILPDDVIDAEVPCLKQMIDVFNERGGSVLATQTVEGPGISAYGVLAGSPDPVNPRIYNCTGMVEKPKFENAPSKQAIIGRYVLTPRVFELLAATPPGMTLTIKGEVIEVNGRRVKFRVEAWDDVDKITEGIHERAIIIPTLFNAKIAEKIAKIPG